VIVPSIWSWDYQADLQTVVAELLSSQYRHPLRAVAFNTEDGSTHDVTAETARKVLGCAGELDGELPNYGVRFRGAGVSVSPNDFVGRSRPSPQTYGSSTARVPAMIHPPCA
jgi:hypothetical protein